MKAKVLATGEIADVYSADNVYWNKLDKRLYREEELDFNFDTPQKQSVTIEGWIARDRFNSELFLHCEEPFRSYSGNQTNGKKDIWRTDGFAPFPLPTDSFPDLKWEDSPKRVKLTIEEL